LHTPACFSFTGGLVKAAHKKVLKNKTDSEILIYYNVNNPPRKIVKKLKSLAHAFCEWKWNATLNLNNKTNKEMKNCRNPWSDDLKYPFQNCKIFCMKNKLYYDNYAWSMI